MLVVAVAGAHRCTPACGSICSRSEGVRQFANCLVVGLVTSLLFVALAAAAMQQMQGSMQRCRNRLCV